MKKNIHPTWNHQAVVKCACGSSFTTGSTQDLLEIDICSQCHPFFTGEMKFVDRQGRVDKFQQRMKLAQKKQADAQARRQQKSGSSTGSNQADPQSYKQLLQQQKQQLKQQTKADAAQAA